MKTADFDFDLPKDRIALRPASPRDSARLLRIGRDGLADRTVRDLPGLLRAGDLLVVNNTRVIPARLTGRRGEAKIKITLHQRHADGTWSVFARPGKRLRPGDMIEFPAALSARVLAKEEGGLVRLDFALDEAAFAAALDAAGTMPLPPYIATQRRPDAQDKADYQTLFARIAGAVAAPTAGLHFTPDLLARLEAAGIGRVEVTLHVGAGTFLPVKVDDLADHRMHAERGIISAETAARINAARAAGGRIIAVGTTSLRVLESAAGDGGAIPAYDDDTRLFITPGYRFRAVDMLLTNFHLPRSTLFVLVSALAGRERMLAAYEHAKAAGYRFYSYGDACLIERLA